MAASGRHTGWRYDPANGRLDIYYRGTRIAHVDATNVATTGNYRAGDIKDFATTQPTNAIVFFTGTAPVGTIQTSSGLFASDTVLRKIVAGGTASAVG